jgi:hypothetical protein
MASIIFYQFAGRMIEALIGLIHYRSLVAFWDSLNAAIKMIFHCNTINIIQKYSCFNLVHILLILWTVNISYIFEFII